MKTLKLLFFKDNSSLRKLIEQYKRQNTKGLRGIFRIISQESTIFRWRIEYLYLSFIKFLEDEKSNSNNSF